MALLSRLARLGMRCNCVGNKIDNCNCFYHGAGVDRQYRGVRMNAVKKSIGWSDYTWNPVTGCKRECSYCYARRIWARFFQKVYGVQFSQTMFHADRLLGPMSIKKPAKIFVGSMSDCEYWSTKQWADILDVCCKCNQHQFMFLSKGSKAYHHINRYKWWPPNCMQGLTLEMLHPYGIGLAMMIDMAGYAPRPFLSFEPLMGPVRVDIPSEIELVIVGAMTGPRAIPPRSDWIQSVLDHVPEEKIYWKSNIKPILQCMGVTGL